MAKSFTLKKNFDLKFHLKETFMMKGIQKLELRTDVDKVLKF